MVGYNFKFIIFVINIMNREKVWIQKNKDWIEVEYIGEHLPNKTHIILLDDKEYEVDTYEKWNNTDSMKKDNLVDIPHLNEPSILEAVNLRYNQDKIYTYTGKILISMNPFKDLKLFTDDKIKDYQLNSKNQEPHIYQLADEAYRNLLKFNKNQTILVSGESGAGKTYSARSIIKYLTCLSKNKSDIEDKVVQSNPILEAFGNAKTLRNDNSSRFGKFIKVQIKNYSIVGCNIETYLLEKIRLLNQEENERNFHIFYQILSNDISKFKYHLLDAENYKFLNYKFIKCRDIDDAKEFTDLMRAFKIMGFNADTVDNILKIVASVLHLGNIIFDDDGNIKGNNEINIVCQLLGLEKQCLIESLCYRYLKTGNENIRIKMNKEESMNALNSLVMKLYENTFNYIVAAINEKLNTDCNSFVGILDIFGFETFEKNYFEQFCINYTNETLQEHFNKYIFKLEQHEYDLEGIDWTHITFPDNKECLDCIEGKNGIISILDEECRLSRGNDKSFTNKIFKKYTNSNYIKKNKKYGSERFIITHYAGDVEYTTENFRSKNLDNISEDIIKILNKIEITKCEMEITSKIKAKSVAMQFKKQLHKLMKIIDDTTPYYIRCIKPNDLNVCNNFNRIRVNEQIKYSGVLSAIKVSRAGYPIRFLMSGYKKRYKLLGDTILNDIDSSNYEYGKTKIFLKNIAYDYLEDKRNESILNGVVLIQKNIRRYLIRNRYLSTLNKIITIQCSIRNYLSKKRYIELKRTRSSICIQKNIRMYIDKKKYISIILKVNTIIFWYKYIKFSIKRNAVLMIQRFVRKTKERIRLKEKTIMQRRWEIMSERFNKQEEERKRNLEALERKYKEEMDKLDLERKRKEEELLYERDQKSKQLKEIEKKLEIDTRRINDDKKLIQEHIRKDVERKMRMASDMEKLIIQNNILKRQLQRQNSKKECIIS